MSQSHTLVIVPTYNEAESLPVLMGAVREQIPQVDLLVVDDASPDGTGDLAAGFARSDSAVHVLHRPGKEGIGRAYLAGFAWAVERGYRWIVEMDADGSHRAEDLGALLSRAQDSDAPDLVLGSRWIPGGAVQGWPRRRELLSRGGNLWVRGALGISVHDATGGFRVYRAEALDQLDLSAVQSQGYCFQVDMAWRIERAGGTVVEVPITFVERREGQSKMSRAIVAEALWRTTAWGARHRARQLAGLFRRRRDARTTG